MWEIISASECSHIRILNDIHIFCHLQPLTVRTTPSITYVRGNICTKSQLSMNFWLWANRIDVRPTNEEWISIRNKPSLLYHCSWVNEASVNQVHCRLYDYVLLGEPGDRGRPGRPGTVTGIAALKGLRGLPGIPGDIGDPGSPGYGAPNGQKGMCCDSAWRWARPCL